MTELMQWPQLPQLKNSKKDKSQVMLIYIKYILVDSTFSLSTQNSKVGHLQLEAEMAECIQRHLSNEAPHPEKCRCVCFLLELKI